MTHEVGSRKPKVGDRVLVVQKKDYQTGKLTAGEVKDVLTSKQFHPRGHKVRLNDGTIGRVQAFQDETGAEVLPEPEKNLPKPNYRPEPDELA